MMDRAHKIEAIRTAARAGLLVGVSSLAALGLLCTASCSGPAAGGTQNANGKMIMSWIGPAARLCVTDTNATCPVEKDGVASGGKVFWVIDAVCFNSGNGFGSPVEYGLTPECAKDVTVAHGGVAGGAPLVLGDTYKITITGFGGSANIQDVVWK
jgi:hypothetical protein